MKTTLYALTLALAAGSTACEADTPDVPPAPTAAPAPTPDTEALVFPSPTRPSADRAARMTRRDVSPDGPAALAYRILLPDPWQVTPPPAEPIDPDLRSLGVFSDPETGARVAVQAVWLRAEIPTIDWLDDYTRRARLTVHHRRVVDRPHGPRVDLLATRDDDAVVRVVAFRHGRVLMTAFGYAPRSHYDAVADDLARATVWLEMQRPEPAALVGEMKRFAEEGLGGVQFTYPAQWTATVRQRSPEHGVVDLTLTTETEVVALLRVRITTRDPGAPPFAAGVELERDALRRNGAALTALGEIEDTPAPDWATAAARADTQATMGAYPSTLTTHLAATPDRLVSVSLWAPTLEAGSAWHLLGRGALAVAWQSMALGATGGSR